MPDAFPIEIRPARADDDAPVARLLSAYIERTHVHFATRPQTPGDVARERASREVHHPWLVATRGGAFAGVARAHPWRAREAYRRSVEVAAYVVEDHRRAGVARALYRRLFDELRAHDVHTCVAGIALPNNASVRFHESLGFAHVGVFREVGRKFDAWHDVLFMQKMLR